MNAGCEKATGGVWEAGSVGLQPALAVLTAARAGDRKGGRPDKRSDKDIAMVRQPYDSRTVTVKEIAARFNLSRSTHRLQGN